MLTRLERVWNWQIKREDEPWWRHFSTWIQPDLISLSSLKTSQLYVPINSSFCWYCSWISITYSESYLYQLNHTMIMIPIARPPVRKKLHLIRLFKKSAQNEFILKQRSSNCLTGSKVYMEDSKEINYAAIRKQMPGAWPAPSLK